MPHRLAEYNPTAAIAAGGGGFAVSAGSSVLSLVGQAVPDANSIPQGSLTAASLMGAAIAGLAFWGQVKAAKRREDAADAAARIEMDTREHAAWGGKYEAELDRRVRAEARLKILEEHVVELKAKLDHMNANIKQGASLNAELSKHNADVLDEVKDRTRKTEVAVKKLAASSGVGLDTGDHPTMPGA